MQYVEHYDNDAWFDREAIMHPFSLGGEKRVPFPSDRSSPRGLHSRNGRDLEGTSLALVPFSLVDGIFGLTSAWPSGTSAWTPEISA